MDKLFKRVTPPLLASLKCLTIADKNNKEYDSGNQLGGAHKDIFVDPFATENDTTMYKIKENEQETNSFWIFMEHLPLQKNLSLIAARKN